MPETQHFLKNVLIAAQCFGLFPLGGISGGRRLHFSYTSPKTVYAFLVMVCYAFCAFMLYNQSLSGEFVFHKYVKALFFLYNLLASVLFVRLARRWPEFIASFSAIESAFEKKYGGKHADWGSLKGLTAVGMSLALAEHVLSELNHAYGQPCRSEITLEGFFKDHYYYVFGYFGYSLPAAVFLTLINLAANFTWTFVDLFLILMSTSTAKIFRRLNGFLERELASAKKPEKSHACFWKGFREDYNTMSRLCSDLDDVLSDLITVSYASNVCFVLVQLFHSLKQKETAMECVYFYYSFGHLIARTAAVTIFATEINEESRKPLAILYALPYEDYCSEVCRLQTQIQTDLVALTGHGFFRITKGFVLKIAAAVVTYELVLMQFNQTTLKKYFNLKNACPE